MTAEEIILEASTAKGAPRGLWTQRDLENYAQVSRSTIWRLIKQGRLSCIRIGRRIRFDPATAIDELKRTGDAPIFVPKS